MPNVLLFSIAAITSSFSLGFIPTIAANLSVNDVLFVCESSFIVSGVLLVVSSILLVKSLLFSFLVLLHLAWVLIPLSFVTPRLYFDRVSQDHFPWRYCRLFRYFLIGLLFLIASCIDHIHWNTLSHYSRICFRHSS